MEFINIVYLVLSLFLLGFAIERASVLAKSLGTLFKLTITEETVFLLMAVASFASVYAFKLDVVSLISGFMGTEWPTQLNLLVTSLLAMSAANWVHKKIFTK